MTSTAHIGVDIGGGSVKIGVVGRNGTVKARAQVPVAPGVSATGLIDKIAAAINGLTSGRINSVGIGFPGTIRPCHQIGENSNIPSLDGFPLARALSDLFVCPARLENDATAAGLAEAIYGQYQQAGRLMVVTLGTGIGVSFFENQKPLRSFGGCLGDLGHTFVVFDNPVRCRIGCLGCLESVASGAALSDIAAACPPDSAIAQHAKGAPPTAFDVIACAKQGDARAIEILTELGTWVGRAAAGWCQTYGPDVVLIGGGLSAAGPHILQPIQHEAARLVMPAYRRHVNFQLASLGNDAGMIGAAAQMFTAPVMQKDPNHV